MQVFRPSLVWFDLRLLAVAASRAALSTTV